VRYKIIAGFDVKLRRTYFQPVPVPPPVPEVSSDTQIPAEQPPAAAEATSTAAQAALPFSGAATSAPAVASKAAPTTAVKAVSKPPGSSSSGGTMQGSKHRISSSGSAGKPGVVPDIATCITCLAFINRKPLILVLLFLQKADWAK
jgi:hypothetical protein